ncbi:MAG TPA: hypothetical protein VF657_25305 [Actinoplanes sp.]
MNALRPGAAPAPGTPAPGTLRWAVRLLFGEAAALALLTAYLLVMDVIADPADLRVAIALTVLTALFAAALAAVARALARRSAAARGPAIVAQIMLMVTAYYLIRGGLWWLGAPLLLLGLTVAVLLVLPPTTRALGLPGT